MLLVFCSSPLDPRQPDEAYEAEVAAAERLGLEYALLNFEALVDENDPARAVRRVPPSPEVALGVFRGWMMRPERYAGLFDALAARGVRLVNDPDAYRHAHHLPESYAAIRGETPESVWLKVDGDVATDEVMALLRPFGSRPVVLKDFVKSRKHEWAEACYIPSAADRAAVERVVRRFLELQGEGLNEGLVFREFVELEPLTAHSRSGMPLTKEYRLFFLDGEPVFASQYWDEGDYEATAPPLERFREAGRRVRSRFFTMDVAKRADGDWTIVELGDAQVAGLPESANVLAFYEALAGRLRG